MIVDPFVWFVVGAMATFGVVLGVVSWTTSSK